MPRLPPEAVLFLLSEQRHLYPFKMPSQYSWKPYGTVITDSAVISGPTVSRLVRLFALRYVSRDRYGTGRAKRTGAYFLAYPLLFKPGMEKSRLWYGILIAVAGGCGALISLSGEAAS